MTRHLVLPLLLALGGLAMAEDPHEHETAHESQGAHATGDLRTIMLALGTEMAHAQEALWREDLVTVARAGRAVADHPHVSPTEMARVQAALGTDFGAFVAADRTTHAAAVALADAAGGGDLSATVQALGAVQAGCVGCHQQFRARLVE
jgi:cytochrome c556